MVRRHFENVFHILDTHLGGNFFQILDTHLNIHLRIFKCIYIEGFFFKLSIDTEDIFQMVNRLEIFSHTFARRKILAII